MQFKSISLLKVYENPRFNISFLVLVFRLLFHVSVSGAVSVSGYGSLLESVPTLKKTLFTTAYAVGQHRFLELTQWNVILYEVNIYKVRA